MDCGSAGRVAGIEPQTLDNWQTESTSISYWKHAGCERPLDWSSSPDSSQNYEETVDLNALNGPLLNGQPDALFIGPSCSYQRGDSRRTHSTTPSKKFKVDATIKGTIGATVNSRSLLSADDSFHLDKSCPHYQLFNNMAAGVSLEAPLLYRYTKGFTTAGNTVIVKDVGNLPQDTGLSYSPPGQFLSFQNSSQAFQFPSTETWDEPSTSLSADQKPNQVPNEIPIAVSTGSRQLNKGLNALCSIHEPTLSLESCSLQSLESQLPINMPAAPLPLAELDPSFCGENNGEEDGSQYNLESLFGSGDFSAIYECSYSAASDEIPAFPERKLDEDSTWNVSQNGDAAPSEIIPRLRGARALVVGETAPENLLTPAPSMSRAPSNVAQRLTPRPQSLGLQSVATVRKRKQCGPSLSLDSQPNLLQIVQENGQNGSIASADFDSPLRRARRTGPLTMVGRTNAGLRRRKKDTCVQCRLRKRKCDGNSPCDACRPTIHEQPCVRACFANIVEYGTSQRAINHPTLDRSGHVRMEIPFEFDLDDLLSFLRERRGRFNIRASQAWGSLYILDLGETYKFLRSLSDYNGNSRSNFLEFVDRRIVESKDKSKNWPTCVKDCDPMSNIYSLLSQWNNMPSRASYSFVSIKEGVEGRPMDICNLGDQREILLAAQLSRIVCRMLEVEGFRKLEQDLYSIKWKQISQEMHLRFLSELGHIVLSLRWRVSWWKRLGDGGREPDPGKQHYVDRVDLLCRILYVYYTCVLAKLPSWSTSEAPKGVCPLTLTPKLPSGTTFLWIPVTKDSKNGWRRAKSLLNRLLTRPASWELIRI
ncbi:Zn(II)2Cys6 transcription factor domain-containing protein [Aspergillus tanneri]|uniref:Zn(2)-C6 fungal-type domain-containing protein n=1 Tax=Aspergillus tanneri TaxID=1220188 RepID=A0A5M9M4X8_9EURO|nr:uncharacterized protein ATNIH1004_010700 [Aspergillus tanneri]KAA8641761.1 hypothetical protein ATNIH1004_010700 [Aspergillus tanneri]